MSPDPFGLGFAGLGVAGKAMIEHLPKEPRLKLAAVQDTNPTLVTQIAEQYASPWHGESFENMLRAPSLDAVVISTPNSFHVPQAEAALRAGKHVLVQKPLATTSAGARATIETAAATGRLLFVDYSYRLLETAAVARATLAQIGGVRAVSAAFHNVGGPRAGRDWFFDPQLSGGGAIMDLGVHMIDFILALLQPREATLERAALEHRPGFRVEHQASLQLEMDGVPVDLGVSWGAPLPQTEISVSVDGERGRLRWHNVDGSFAHFQTHLDERLLIDREITLRENTLHAFAAALADGAAPGIDIRVYDLLDESYSHG
jgi:predicted dehydrogenase